MTPFKTIWYNLSLCTQLTPFKTIWPNFIIVYPTDSFQDNFTSFPQMVLKGVNWVHNDKIRANGLERSQLGEKNKNQFIWSWKEVTLEGNPYIFYIVYSIDSFKTIWHDVCIVYSIDSFQDHMIQFYHCVPNWLLSIPYDKSFVLYCVPSWLLSRPFDPIL